MDDNKRKFQQYDWEGISFPITMSNIVNKTNHYNIPIDSELTIWRDKEYRLKGLLKGVVDDKDDLEYKEDGEIKKVGFIDGEVLTAKSEVGDYLIEGLCLEKVTFFAVNGNATAIGLGFSCEVLLESIKVIDEDVAEPDIISEWYLCSMPEVRFSNRTSRYDSHPNYKIRNGIDSPIENEDEYFRKGYSSSWDHVVVKHKDHKIILQTIPNDYLPNGIDGVAIEYRKSISGFPSFEFRKMFREYISFIFGTHLQRIGESEFSIGYKLLNSQSENPWKRSFKKNGNINPIPLKNGASRDFFENQLNELLPNFISLYEKTSLSDCLWKLWIGSELSIGTNLPIIASGFEMLVNSYLENNNLLRKYSKQEKNDYRSLIAEELGSLRVKLASYDFAPFVLNKLENPYNFGIGEKIKIFLKSISLEFENDSKENEALKARNLMTHQGFDFKTTEEQQRVKKISDAYVTLVNRVILKLLNYDRHYVDYSKEGIRYLRMNENM